MGGWIASVFAYESPNRVNKLVLVGSGGARPRTIPSMTEFKPPSRDDIKERLASQTNPALHGELDQWADEDYANTQIPGALEAYQKILNHMNDGMNRVRYNTIRRFEHITSPTLVLWGKDDQTNALEMGEETHRLIKGSKLVVLDTDHFVPTQAPGRVQQGAAGVPVGPDDTAEAEQGAQRCAPCCLGGGYSMRPPPSTWMVLPMMCSESSLTRNRTTLA